MAVYVDSARNQFGRKIMCHMVADTREELHAMAAAIGLRREWFQDCPPHSAPHYDVSYIGRSLAVAAGAIEVDKYTLVEVIRKARALGWP